MLQPSALQILPLVTLLHLECDGNSTHGFSGKGKTPPHFPFWFSLPGSNSMHLALLSSPPDCQAPSLKSDFFYYFGLLHTMNTHCLAAARLWTSANSHSEELPPAYDHFPELSESLAGGKGSLRKELQMLASIQHGKVLCYGRVTALAPWQSSGGYKWEFSRRWSITLHWFPFDQKWCVHYYRGASGSEGEISPPRDATLLPTG